MVPKAGSECRAGHLATNIPLSECEISETTSITNSNEEALSDMNYLGTCTIFSAKVSSAMDMHLNNTDPNPIVSELKR